MSRPVDAGIDPHRGDDDPGEGVGADAFRDALARWATGVTVVAVRGDGRVYGTTVSSFGSVSAEPPRIVISLGPGAQVLPFLREGRRFGISILAEGQKRIATDFADPFPVGSSPFPEEGDPVIPDAHASLVCVVEDVVEVGACRLVVGLVVETATGGDEGPLLHHLREYRRLS